MEFRGLQLAYQHRKLQKRYLAKRALRNRCRNNQIACRNNGRPRFDRDHPENPFCGLQVLEEICYAIFAGLRNSQKGVVFPHTGWVDERELWIGKQTRLVQC
jgi:hypothetical protein